MSDKRLVIISGMAGSGKSSALNMLEDLDFYCIDNLPVRLLETVVNEVARSIEGHPVSQIAIGLDARNSAEELETLPAIIQNFRRDGIQCDILFLQTEDTVLLKRFRETRRKHPLGDSSQSLPETLKLERELMTPLANAAELIIDTTQTGVYELRDVIAKRVAGRVQRSLSILIESFGFKHAIPADSDFVFDVRCLPNPYWEPQLRLKTGRDDAVKQFLNEQPLVQEMFGDILAFISRWIPHYVSFNRHYLTLAIGCTGGQHRSVYMVEKLALELKKSQSQVHIRHNELP